MRLYVLDTDSLSLLGRGDSAITARVQAANPLELAITVITVEETLSGWYSLYGRQEPTIGLRQLMTD